MPDLTKLSLYSETPAFKNLNEYAGSFNISGTVVGGVNTRTFDMTLPFAPQIADVRFFGRGDQGFALGDHIMDPRPSNTWFKQGRVFVRGDGGFYVNEGTMWTLNYSISGNILTVTAICVQQFLATLTLTPETVQVKVVDYIST